MAKKWMYVRCADVERTHLALVDPDERWNGWLMPWFAFGEAASMNEWLPEFEDSLVYDEGGDAFYTTYDPECVEAFKGEEVEGMHLYPIGRGSWCWEEA